MIPQVVCMLIKSWETLLELYPEAALYMKEKLVFLLVAPCSQEGLINILLPAEAFRSEGCQPHLLRSLIISTVCPLFGSSEKSLLKICPEAHGAHVITYSNQPDTHFICLHSPLQSVFKK